MILPIVRYGDPILRSKGKPITKITPAIRQLAADMLETMYAANGVGLAAQQVGQAVQLTVVDVLKNEELPSTLEINGEQVELEPHMPMILINPKLELGRETAAGQEGCLSFPEITGSVVRSVETKVTATDLEGKPVKFTATGLLARAVQHETDHLNGVLFIDRMNSATKVGLASRLKRLQRA